MSWASLFTCQAAAADATASGGHVRKLFEIRLSNLGRLAERAADSGWRPLLVAKKCFVARCAEGIQARLRRLGLADARVVTGDWDAADLTAPCVVPLISYGLIGTNLFEDYTGAYCLTGYYVDEAVIDTVLQDVLASDGHLPIRITTEGAQRLRGSGFDVLLRAVFGETVVTVTPASVPRVLALVGRS